MAFERARTRLVEEIEALSDDEVEMVQDFVSYMKVNPEAARNCTSGFIESGEMEVVWRCMECGNTWHKSEGTPETCPNCGAPKVAFYLVEED
jgi:rubrerythrin